MIIDRKTVKAEFISLVCFMMLSGCGSNSPETSKEDTNSPISSETTENAHVSTKPSDIIEGTYVAQAVMTNGNLVAFKDSKQLADLYDTNWVVVYNDGTFGIQNGVYWSSGYWDRINIENYDNAFLFAQKESARGSENSHSSASSSEKTYIGYLTNADENTFILVDKEYEEGDTVLVYVRDGKESVYLSASAETASSGNSGSGSSSSSSSSSSGSSSSSSSSSGYSSSGSYSSSTTSGQRNAVNKAKEYLEFIAFSHDGLVDQLEYEGFSHSDAVYGADHCGADWYEQAEKKAREYLDYMSFSYSGLYEQLLYEGFTEAEAKYGCDRAY